jgi:hypothetical protein
MRLPRFQFRLRTLLIGVTLLAVPCGYVAWQAKIVRERIRFREQFFVKINPFEEAETDTLREPASDGKVGWLRRFLGDAERPFFTVSKKISVEDLNRVEEAFPESAITQLREQ